MARIIGIFPRQDQASACIDTLRKVVLLGWPLLIVSLRQLRHPDRFALREDVLQFSYYIEPNDSATSETPGGFA